MVKKEKEAENNGMKLNRRLVVVVVWLLCEVMVECRCCVSGRGGWLSGVVVWVGEVVVEWCCCVSGRGEWLSGAWFRMKFFFCVVGELFDF